MAEAVSNSENDGDDSNIEANPKDDRLECAVCLQTCIHLAQLPCGHIFCFLCVKGIVHQSKKCPMCRMTIPSNFIEQPNLLQRTSVAANTGDDFSDGYQWFYEGRNGWWCYEQRTSEDIEQAFKLNLPCLELLICGELYVVDFENKVQYSKKHPLRKRTIKRDLLRNVRVKGVAGLK